MSELLAKMYRAFLAVQMVSAAASIINNVIDNLIISNFVGVVALGASGVVTPATLLPCAFGNILTMGLYNVVSENIGAKNYLLAGRQLSAVCLTSLIIFVPLTIVFMVFAQPLCAALCGSSDSELYLHAVGYLTSLAPSLILAVILPLFMYVCQMNNQPRWCLVATGVMLVANIGGDLFVALCTDWGMLGIGAASTISTYLALLVVAPIALKKDNTLRPRGNLALNETLASLGKIVTYGAPSALTTASNSLSGMFVNFVLVSQGLSMFIAANSCVMTVFSILYLSGTSLWYCTSAITSTLLGRHMYGALRLVPTVFVKFTVVGATASAIVALIFAGPLTGLFLSADAAVNEVAEIGLRILVLNLYFNALVTCFQSLFRSTGHRIVAAMLPTIYLLAFMCPLTYLFTNAIGPLGCFIARVLAYFMGLLLIVGVCCAKKKSSPLSPDTYLFLPEDEPGTFEEVDLVIHRPDQIDDAVNTVFSFYDRDGIDQVERECVTHAFEELINGICLKEEVEDAEKGRMDKEASLLCWIHLSQIKGALSVLTINGHGNASNFFVTQFIEKTHTPLELLNGERSSMPLIIDGEVYSIDSTYFDFLMHSSIEIKVEKE